MKDSRFFFAFSTDSAYLSYVRHDGGRKVVRVTPRGEEEYPAATIEVLPSIIVVSNGGEEQRLRELPRSFIDQVRAAWAKG